MKNLKEKPGESSASLSNNDTLPIYKLWACNHRKEVKMEGDKAIRIGVIGTGMIGTSIAVLMTGHGYKTTLLAMNDELQEKSRQQYETFYQALMEKGLVSYEQFAIIQTYLSYTQTYAELADVDYIFECAFEKLSVKHEIYSKIEAEIKDPHAIISTTSALSADDLAAGMDRYSDRMVVAHPFFPPHLVPYWEVVKSKKTKAGIAEDVASLLESVDREVVVLKKNAPGFIANRLQHALFREAINIVERGIADPRDVDKAAMYSFMPRYTKIGIFEHLDNSGVDLNYDIENYLFKDLSNADCAPKMICDLMEKKEYGVKSGKGVYDWSQVDMDDFRARISAPYWDFFNWKMPDNKNE